MTTTRMQYPFNHSSRLQSRDDFGPAASERFDFTSLFEETILSIAPSAILLLLSPLRLWVLRKQQPKVAKSVIHEQKLVCETLHAVRCTNSRAIDISCYLCRTTTRTSRIMVFVAYKSLHCHGRSGRFVFRRGNSPMCSVACRASTIS